ncbi:MAG TPA: alpha/beta-hydrolase family protein [Actinomycetes bacterium]|nr:alpha/beta-hydrolase family protein [Actinomycetes bacterium]
MANGSGLSGRGEQTGLLAAAAVTPGTFEPSLVPRSLVDQGIITGLATTLTYVLTVGTQDAIEAAASLFAESVPGASAEARQRNAAMLLDLAVIPAGLLAQRAIPKRPGEAVARGALRQSAWRTAATGVGGATFAAVQLGTETLDRLLGANGRIARMPVAIPAGLLLAFVVESRRRQGLPEEIEVGEATTLKPVESVGAGIGASLALTLVAYGEHELVRAIAAGLASVLPGSSRLWRPAGHALVLGGLAAGGTALFNRTVAKIEAGTSRIEPILDDAVAARWVGGNVSGGPGSLVPWDTLGREGRRHAFAYVRPRPVEDRPAGLPDLSIETVMGQEAKTEPVQVYVGLDSAPTAAERVDLALAEMDRTGAWDRSVLMLISPTGTGYVNYCATAAAEYLTLGDIATVTLQYSKRPSPLSLFKVKDAREQNRLLWLRISERLIGRTHRPKVVLFGESLGAHTSQDVLLHWGTLGPQALGIERALWIGTPYGSGWMHEVTGPPRPDVDPDVVVMVNDFGQVESMPEERRQKLRYVMVSHDNDGVTKFGADLVATRPAWLSDERPRVEVVPGASPRGIPARMRWRPLTTFLQSMVDMKNAQIPGAYRAWAHDYRPDLTRFISEVYDLPATKTQIEAIEAALQAREEVRDKLFTAESLGALSVSLKDESEPGA